MAGDEAGKLRVGVEVDASNVAGDLASKTEGSAKKSGVSIGGLVGKGLKIGAVAAAGGIATVLTGAFVKGFTRLTSIDSAKAKLEGLGYTGNTLKSVMDNALNSVKGTAFGLDEAVSAVPGLLAAGVKPGKDLEQALKNMGSTATLAGSSFSEVSDVFGDAAAKGTLTTETLNRMAERGIPALQLVADHLGVTREAAAKMATDGEISFKQFQDALTAGIGPAALAAGDSFQGMMANTMAALGRFGAAALQPFFDNLKRLMPSLMTAFDALTAAIGPVMAKLAPIITAAFDSIIQAIDQVDWAAVASNIGKIANVFIDWAPAILGVVGAIVALNLAFRTAQGIFAAYSAVMGVVRAAMLGFQAAAAGAAIAEETLTGATNAQKIAMIAGAVAQKIATAAQWLWNAALTANPIGIIIVAIAALVAALIWFFTQTELGREIWANFMSFLVDTWTNIVSVATTIWTGLADFFTGLWADVSQVFMDIWANISAFFIGIWTGIAAFLQPAIDAIANIFRVLGETLANIWLVIRAIFVVAWQGIVAVVGPIITWLVDVITSGVEAVQSVWETVWGAISDYFADVWAAMVAVFAPIIKRIQTFIGDTIRNVRVVWNAVWGAISAYFQNLWRTLAAFIVGIMVRVYNAIRGPLNTIRGIWNAVWGAVRSFFVSTWNNIVSAVSSAIGRIMGFISGIRGKVMSAVSGAIGWLVQVGRDIIQGMINGITSMIGAVKSAVSNTVNGVIDWAKGILGENSPSKVFDKIGVDLGKGFVNGIDSMASDVQAAVGTMTLGAVDVAGATVTAIPTSPAQAASGITNTSNLTIEPGAFQLAGADPYKTSLLVVDRIAEKVAV